MSKSSSGFKGEGRTLGAQNSSNRANQQSPGQNEGSQIGIKEGPNQSPFAGEGRTLAPKEGDESIEMSGSPSSSDPRKAAALAAEVCIIPILPFISNTQYLGTFRGKQI